MKAKCTEPPKIKIVKKSAQAVARKNITDDPSQKIIENRLEKISKGIKKQPSQHDEAVIDFENLEGNEEKQKEKKTHRTQDAHGSDCDHTSFSRTPSGSDLISPVTTSYMTLPQECSDRNHAITTSQQKLFEQGKTSHPQDSSSREQISIIEKKNSQENLISLTERDLELKHQKAMMQVLTVENEELKQRCKIQRRKKVELEQEIEEIKANSGDDKLAWIEAQMERNYKLEVHIKECIEKFTEYKQQIEEGGAAYKEVIKILSQRNYDELETTCECSTLLSQIEIYIKSAKESFEIAGLVGIESKLNTIFKELKTERGGQIKKANVSNLEIDLKIKTEELEEEHVNANKWKTMYAELITQSNKLDNDLSAISLLGPDQMQSRQKNQISDSLASKRIEKFEEREKILTQENIDLKQREQALLKENSSLIQRINNLTQQLHEVPESKKEGQPLDSEDIINKLSLIILGKYDEASVSESDIFIIRKLFGDNAIKMKENYNEKIENVTNDCKALLGILLNYV